MTKKDFKDYICLPFCMFYKDGQKEEMACQGALVIESLINQGRMFPEQLYLIVKDLQLCLKHKDTLTRYMCRRCPFMKEDCDFQSTAPSHDLEPCGGYIVLAGLIENRVIEPRDMKIQK
ncbi:MAG: hypothetical protein R6U40_13420 [Desulfobacterales bacterium]